MQLPTQPSKPSLTDEWWVPAKVFAGVTSLRRVLADGNGFVLYSDGSRKTKECTKEQFEAWRRRFACTRPR